jgi:hypothetical protein
MERCRLHLIIFKNTEFQFVEARLGRAIEISGYQ